MAPVHRSREAARGWHDRSVSPSMSPGSPRDLPDEGGTGDWARQSAAVGRPRRAEPEQPGGRRDDSDPYGWATVTGGPGPGPGTGGGRPDEPRWPGDPAGEALPRPEEARSGRRTDRLRRPHKRR